MSSAQQSNTISEPKRDAWKFARIRMEHLWVGLPFFAALWKGMVFSLPLFDFWWHLKMGELIVTTGTIPRTDPFSFTAASYDEYNN